MTALSARTHLLSRIGIWAQSALGTLSRPMGSFTWPSLDPPPTRKDSAPVEEEAADVDEGRNANMLTRPPARNTTTSTIISGTRLIALTSRRSRWTLCKYRLRRRRAGGERGAVAAARQSGQTRTAAKFRRRLAWARRNGAP